MSRRRRRKKNGRTLLLLAVCGLAVAGALVDRFVLSAGEAGASSGETAAGVGASPASAVVGAAREVMAVVDVFRSIGEAASGAEPGDLSRLFAIGAAGPPGAVIPRGPDDTAAADIPGSVGPVLGELPRLTATRPGPRGAAVIDGVLLRVGESSGRVTLVAVNDRGAVVSVDGVESVLKLD